MRSVPGSRIELRCALSSRAGLVDRNSYDQKRNKMSNIDNGLDMELSSGIAAYETKFFDRAVKLLSPLAEEGNPEAQYRMAIMAQNGLGMVVNELMAYKNMKAAADAGHGMSQHGLGFMYLEGECVEKNEEKAVFWFRKAAEQGLAGSQATLGMLYKEGRGVEKNPEEARRWYKLAGFDE
ncbi:Sel1 domain protein repeat-containing protein [endosymbiont of Riftia pachyptila (vent Ph05)]|nr:Sel1 domain protein repeat-containing protein [endosymbiont of Riftia pachyptila (vent Ph05)]